MQSCTEDLAENELTLDGKISTTISVTVPQLPDAHPQTRAMAMKPQMTNLYLAVFDENGYLLEYVKADNTTQMAKENEVEYTFDVSLTPTDFRTIVHFIGNAPETVSFGTEAETIGRLFTENGNEAYWERVVFPNGIKKGTDGKLSSEVTGILADIRLVRNFAWIKLTSNASNFVIDSYCVMNTRTKGSVAPYNTNSSEFADFANQQTYADLISESYNGFIPADAELNKAIPNESEWFKANGVNSDNYAYYVYEREKPTADPTFILVKGTYTPEGGSASQNGYYKVDLRQANGDYFPIIRNFRYNITITTVKHEGHETAQEAVAGAGSGDVSTAIETEDYTNISNNVARIFVSYTDTTLVNQMSDLKLRYKFMVFETKDGNGNVTPQQILNGDANVTIDTDIPGTVINSLSRAGADATDGWREITISTTKLGASRKSQDIIIKGKVKIGNGDAAKTYELQRKVTINLRQRYDMQLVCDPGEIQKKVGEPFDVIIKVPGGLGSALFPLEFQLEARNQSMTPNMGDDLPVVTGKSIIAENSTKTTIGFIKNLEWDDYNALTNVGGYKSVVCHFKSNKAISATDIYARNKYFNQALCNLGNYVPSTFSNLDFSKNNITPAEDVAFSFNMSQIPTQGFVYVTLVGLDPADDEDGLEWDSEKSCYKYNPQSTSGSFKLTCTGTNNPASVKLSAYHFADAEEEINVQLNTFSSLKFNPSYLRPGQIQEVEFSFNMSTAPSNDVFVTLTNLVPADDKLTPVDANTGKYKFKTRPTGTSASITLKNTVSQAGTVGTVKLSSLYFNDATASISMRYIIPGDNIYLSDTDIPNSNTTFTLYTSDPGSSWNPSGGSFGTFDASRNGSVNDIEITSDVYETIQNNDGIFYVRFRTGGIWDSRYYVAEVKLEELLKGPVTLDFKQQ